MKLNEQIDIRQKITFIDDHNNGFVAGNLIANNSELGVKIDLFTRGLEETACIDTCT